MVSRVLGRKLTQQTRPRNELRSPFSADQFQCKYEPINNNNWEIRLAFLSTDNFP